MMNYHPDRSIIYPYSQPVIGDELSPRRSVIYLCHRQDTLPVSNSWPPTQTPLWLTKPETRFKITRRIIRRTTSHPAPCGENSLHVMQILCWCICLISLGFPPFSKATQKNPLPLWVKKNPQLGRSEMAEKHDEKNHDYRTKTQASRYFICGFCPRVFEKLQKALEATNL